MSSWTACIVVLCGGDDELWALMLGSSLVCLVVVWGARLFQLAEKVLLAARADAQQKVEAWILMSA